MRILISFFPNCPKMVRLEHKRNKGEHIFHWIRKTGRIGGVGFTFQVSLAIKPNDCPQQSHKEVKRHLHYESATTWMGLSQARKAYSSKLWALRGTDYTAKIFALRRSHLLRQSIDTKMHQRDDAFPYHTFEKTRKSQPHLCFLLRLCKRRFQKQWQRCLIWFLSTYCRNLPYIYGRRVQSVPENKHILVHLCNLELRSECADFGIRNSVWIRYQLVRRISNMPRIWGLTQAHQMCLHVFSGTDCMMTTRLKREKKRRQVHAYKM